MSLMNPSCCARTDTCNVLRLRRPLAPVLHHCIPCARSVPGWKALNQVTANESIRRALRGARFLKDEIFPPLKTQMVLGGACCATAVPIRLPPGNPQGGAKPAVNM
ncbi:hypothetical protein XELAEV_18040894mg [Xenopus laevis]|uniref:Uncharacterized protein n=1 Tax=Xenopus laevis TaxID=8355 RepID=A0A974CAZ5_XENLA|nr:hypothetical protein XELAEV_18040894mg [Xenopus laevis]